MGARIVGIDLGTTNSVIAFWDGHEPKVIPDQEGGHLTPSVVALSAKGQLLVGAVARRQMSINPQNTVHSIKRLMGRRAREVLWEVGRVSYKVVPGPDSGAAVDLGGRVYSAAEISAQ